MTSKRAPKKSKKAVVADEGRVSSAAGGVAWHALVAALALCVLVLVAYWNSTENGFVWDDHEQIVMNPYMKPGAPLVPIFTQDVRFTRQDQSGHTQVYRPLQLLTYRVIEEWFGNGPEGFRACSILLALGGSLAVFWVFWLLTKRLDVAFGGAALFAVYPVHTEAVDWIAATPDLGFGLFLLVACGLFVVSRWTSRGWMMVSLSLAAFSVALLWKETAVVFPLLAASYVWLLETGGNRWRRVGVESAPYWVVLGVYLAVRTAVLGKLSTGPRDWALTPVQSVLTMMHLMVSYWAKLALPVGLNAYHLFDPVRSVGDYRGWLALVLLACAIAGFVVLARRAPLAAFAMLWVVIFLVPAMNFNGLGRNPFAERYLYLPSAGFCLLVVLAVGWALGRAPVRLRMPVGAGLLVAVLSWFTAETIARNADWKDDNTLFAKTMQQSPDAPFVRYMVATAQSGDSTQSGAAMAEENYRKTIALAKQQTPPDRLFVLKGYEGLASLYSDRAQYPQALEMLAEAKAIAPNDPDVTAENGLVLARAGHGLESEAALNQALLSQPNNENVLVSLGLIARGEHHDLRKAAEFFKRAIAAHSQDDDFSASQHNNLAAVYGDLGDFDAALAELRLAVKILPKDPEFHVNLASALAATGHIEDARVEVQTALAIAPDDENAHEVLERLNQMK